MLITPSLPRSFHSYLLLDKVRPTAQICPTTGSVQYPVATIGTNVTMTVTTINQKPFAITSITCVTYTAQNLGGWTVAATDPVITVANVDYSTAYFAWRVVKVSDATSGNPEALVCDVLMVDRAGNTRTAVRNNDCILEIGQNYPLEFSGSHRINRMIYELSRYTTRRCYLFHGYR